MTNPIEAASAALAQAYRGATLPALIPALSGCPDCGTARMIAAPGPLGTCPDCGMELRVLDAPGPAAAR